MFDLTEIPSWLGEAAASALGWVFVAMLTSLGWVLKALFDWYQNSRMPYVQDKKRYDNIINHLDVESIYFDNYEPFVFGDGSDKVIISLIRPRIIDKFHTNLSHLKNNRMPTYLDSAFSKKEKALLNSFEDLQVILSESIDFNPLEDYYFVVEEEQEIKVREITTAATEVRKKYEDFRDHGNKVFAEKINLRGKK